MTRRIAILRPAPANLATAARVREAGAEPVTLPLFDIVPLVWDMPEPAAFDGLLLTSANAVRHGGPQLDRLKSLKALAVGQATATAARDAGFEVALTGEQGISDLLARDASFRRLLWLTGRDRTESDHLAIAAAIPVYAAEARQWDAAQADALIGATVLLHSTRAAHQFCAEVARHGIARTDIAIAAISAPVAEAAGAGWAAITVADRPNDAALIATAIAPMIDPHAHRENKRPMTPDAPPVAPSRGLPLAAIAVATLIAFLAGLAAMALLMRFGGPWSVAPVAPPASVAAPIAPPSRTDIDVATLAAREQALAARLDALDARLGATDVSARTAASYAGRAEGMMLIFAARRAIERGQPLGFIDGELRARFGTAEPQAVATVVGAAGEPVTLEDLRFALDRIAPRLSTSEPREGWWGAVQREIGSLVIIRKESAPSPHPRERLMRARRLLEQGLVEATLAEIARLPGAQGAESWMAAASRYVETRRALDTLEAAAIQGRIQPAAGALPATQP